jgi:AcrR family transcriptional regulator
MHVAVGDGRKVEATRTDVLEAAWTVLRQRGYAGLTTRAVAAEARVPLSQIHYHFGSKQGLILALFEHQNARLVARQRRMFADPSLTLSEQWDQACDYLEEDLDSGYVRVLMELWAAGWSDPIVARAVRDATAGWTDLLTEAAAAAGREHDWLGGLEASDVAALVGSLFIGAEARLLLDLDDDTVPVRRSLRRFGAIIRRLEGGAEQEDP